MKKFETEKKIQIPPLQTKTVRITLVGTSPLLVHRFSEKSKTEIADKQQKKAKNAKLARDPKAEYESSLYRMPGKKNSYGIPTSGIKNAAVSACRFVDGFPMSKATGSFHILEDADGLTSIEGKPTMDERMVRIGPFGKKVSTPRYRGRFDKWKTTFDCTYNESVMSSEQLVHLFDVAGFAIGLCEHRPEKRGSLGRFEVQRSK